MDGNEEDIKEIYCKKGYIKWEALRPLRTNSVRENFKQSKPDLERGYPFKKYWLQLTSPTETRLSQQNKQKRFYHLLLPTILEKTTWENVFISAHYLTQQNYFQINGFA